MQPGSGKNPDLYPGLFVFKANHLTPMQPGLGSMKFSIALSLAGLYKLPRTPTQLPGLKSLKKANFSWPFTCVPVLNRGWASPHPG